MLTESVSCPICREPATCEASAPGSTHPYVSVSCPRCGAFKAPDTCRLQSFIAESDRLYIYSSVVRNMTERGERVDLREPGSWERLMETSMPPEGPFERIDMLLKHVLRKVNGKYSEETSLNLMEDFPLVFARNMADLRFHIEKAYELRLLEVRHIDDSRYMVRLSLDGWKRLADLKTHRPKSDQAFVAMWFDRCMDDAWARGFKTALEETGYKPVRVDQERFNDKICDKIVSEIKRSALLIADITGERSGVFFEAGLAYGKGIPVIWTCRKDFAEKLDHHFDTRQYNHLIWSDAEHLRSTLADRIEATVGHPTLPTQPL